VFDTLFSEKELVTEVKSKPEWCKLAFIHLKMSGKILSGFFYSMIYTVQNNLKPKSKKLTSSPTKMQQPDAAVSSRETRSIEVSTLPVI
jgi:hypothetical protein